jgi:phenylacetic acid degradation protein
VAVTAWFDHANISFGSLNMANCFAIEDLIPVVDPTAYVHPAAVLIGDVIVGPRCFIGPAACLRGDFGRIILHEGVNVQDTCVMHGFPDGDTVVEIDGHIGHGSVVHGAHIGRNVLIGMNAVIMDRAQIGESSIVGAMAFVREGMIIPPRMLALGIPARVARPLTEAEMAWKRGGTQQYQELAIRSLASQRPCEPLTVVQANRPRFKGGSSVTFGAVKTPRE